MSHVILYYYILEQRVSIFIPVYDKARIDSIGSIFKLSFTKKLQYCCILQSICTPTCTFFRCPDFVVFMVYLLDSSVTNMEASSKCMHMECQSGPNTSLHSWPRARGCHVHARLHSSVCLLFDANLFVFF